MIKDTKVQSFWVIFANRNIPNLYRLQNRALSNKRFYSLYDFSY